mmetsp:Transcript_9986/g.28996  ORF Transcript_9986/g.28996 Transcript_9986/m.28996 type:complete len:535 (+) Transcript_9986:79-1683(+)
MRALGLLPCVTFSCDSSGSVSDHAFSLGRRTGPRPCGCAWAAEGGCGVSREQSIRDWEALPAGMPGCSSGGPSQSEECALRRKIARLAESAEDAPALYQAVVKDVFRYSAATAVREVSPDPVPTLREAIAKQQNCSARDEESCDPKSCAWTPDSQQWRCHIRPIDGARLMSQYAYALLDLKRAYLEARCRALHEPPRGSGPPRCGKPCRMKDGVCELDRTMLQDLPVRTIMDNLCQEVEMSEKARLEKERHKWEYRYEASTNGILQDRNAKSQLDRIMGEETCISPCRRIRGICSGSLDEAAVKWGRSNETEQLVRAYGLLMSATMLHEDRCRAPELALPRTCRATPPICDEGGNLVSVIMDGGPMSVGVAGGGLFVLGAVLGSMCVVRRWLGRSNARLVMEEVRVPPEQELVSRTVSLTSAAAFSCAEVASGPGAHSREESGPAKAFQAAARAEAGTVKPAGRAEAGAVKPPYRGREEPTPPTRSTSLGGGLGGGTASTSSKAATGQLGSRWEPPGRAQNTTRATDILRRGWG